MKFCAYCGRQLQDDEVCNCRDTQKTTEEVQAQAAAEPQNAAPASDYYQAPYTSNVEAPKGGKKVACSRALRSRRAGCCSHRFLRSIAV